MFRKFSEGFITATGTPLDKDGEVVKDSLGKHVQNQVRNGIDGILCMGTMGVQPIVRNTVFPRVAKVVADLNLDVPVMVGCMDNSIGRVKDRIKSLGGCDIDGIALTTPYYFELSQEEVSRFFSEIAEFSPFPVYLYDIPQRTKTKMERDTVKKLAEHENIWGIKCSHDPAYVRELHDCFEGDEDFHVISAQVDLMDVFYRYGLKRHLDGIFCLFPQWIGELKQYIEEENWDGASSVQRRITGFRNDFLKLGGFPVFTCCMNLLGFAGDFAPDYSESDPGMEESAQKLLVEYGLV